MLIFALPWLSVLLVVVHIISCSPSPLCPLHCLCLTCNKWFHASFFFKYSFWTLSHLPPFPLFSFSPSFLMLVMSALACFGVTNHPLQNLRAKSKRPPTQKPCITIGCFLLATTYLALCLLLCVRPLACPALPCPDWRLLLRALSVIGCADGERVVHQNMGFLLTGTTSVRSVSTKSRAKMFPWEMTPPSLRRKSCFTWWRYSTICGNTVWLVFIIWLISFSVLLLGEIRPKKCMLICAKNISLHLFICIVCWSDSDSDI